MGRHALAGSWFGGMKRKQASKQAGRQASKQASKQASIRASKQASKQVSKQAFKSKRSVLSLDSRLLCGLDDKTTENRSAISFSV